MGHVYRCGPSGEDDRPVIDFDLEVNAENDWLTIGKVLSGKLPATDFPSRVTITVEHPDATVWDCFMDGGARGLYSTRFVEAVGHEGLSAFSLFSAILNGVEYVFLRCDRPVDCLDRQNSLYDTFPHDPTRIIDIQHFAFQKRLVTQKAKLFCIPELPDLFATEQMAAKINGRQLTGVRLVPTP